MFADIVFITSIITLFLVALYFLVIRKIIFRKEKFSFDPFEINPDDNFYDYPTEFYHHPFGYYRPLAMLN